MILKSIVTAVAALLVAAVLQADVSVRIAVGPARPDFLLLTVVCIGLLTSTVFSLASGLLAGIVMAALAGINYGTFIASRIAAGWVSAQVARTISRESLLAPLTAMAAATVASRVVTFLMAPGSLRDWAVTSAGELLYNVALVLPAYMLLQPILRPKRVREPYERRLRRHVRRASMR
ncbi:MAG: hypothetical protein P4L33_17300 [Capsulimonadaceae bacterium]|nr:hypothetical protein [Capsulimonadaceae bacterium]